MSTGRTSRIRNGATDDLPADDATSRASGFFELCEPTPLDNAAGSNPTHAAMHVMRTGRNGLLFAGSAHGRHSGHTTRDVTVIRATTTMIPFMIDMPNRPMNPIAADKLKGVPVRNSARMPPISASGRTLAAKKACRNPPKLKYNSITTQQQTHPRNGDRLEPRQRPFVEFTEFPDPFQPYAGGQVHFAGDLRLCVERGAAEVASADAVFHRYVALLGFPVDLGGSSYDLNVRDVTEREWESFRYRSGLAHSR